MHIINNDNYVEAEDAVRDILMMYVEMADGTEGFGHNADVYIRFDPLKFVDAEQGDAHYVDLDLLRAGSAVATLCAFYDLWAEEQEMDEFPLATRFQAAVAEGRFRYFPEIENVISEAIDRKHVPIEDNWMEDAVAPIYRKYVLGFFGRLSTRDRSSVDP